MKKYIFLLSMVIYFIGCGGDNEKSIAINNIEKSINKKTTTVGCGKNKNSGEECKEGRDSAEFILNTLAKEKGIENENEDIEDIKKNLNSSLKIIAEEENRKRKIKDSLIALVNKVDNSKEVKKKRLEDFINSIDNEKYGEEEDLRKISIIKDELTNLVELNSRDLKSKDIKRRLENLIADVTESKKTLSQTQKSLKKLVESVEKKQSSSAKKFANAIIKDVKSKKIAILEEKEDYFVIKVQKGDNLSILAKRYYNDKKKYKLIYEANKDKINSKYEIFPNTKLVIPKI